MDGTGNIHIAVRDEITLTLIDISDTGKGIAPKNIKKVFKPGFSTKKRGWGLGLSLSKRIMSEYHYGDIFVKKSEVGKGTTFRIILKR
jgi:signal transduction histidine kinase